MYCVKRSSVINLIYSRQQLFSHTVIILSLSTSVKSDNNIDRTEHFEECKDWNRLLFELSFIIEGSTEKVHRFYTLVL
jgi:hypothetical protein